jgi:hypothetical protein
LEFICRTAILLESICRIAVCFLRSNGRSDREFPAFYGKPLYIACSWGPYPPTYLHFYIFVILFSSYLHTWESIPGILKRHMPETRDLFPQWYKVPIKRESKCYE